MNVSIIVALIGFAGTLATVIGGQIKLRADIMAELKQHEAVQDERIKALTEHVDKHNHIIERTYDLETRVSVLEHK